METFKFVIVGLLVVGGGAVAIALVIAAVRAGQAKKHRFLESLARRLKGEYSPAGFMVNGRITFEIGGRKAVVEFVASSSEDDLGRTLVVVPLQRSSPGTLHILREGFGQVFLKLFGAQDLSIGDRAFDAAYVVRAVPESLAAEVFAPQRRDRVIAAVRRLEHLTNATIELTRDQLRVQVREELRHEGGVVALVKTAEEFLEFLQLKPGLATAGIELGEVRIDVDTHCPVCGTTLGSLAVRCDSCRTPHHADCWTYAGRCSTYACNGKRWVS